MRPFNYPRMNRLAVTIATWSLSTAALAQTPGNCAVALSYAPLVQGPVSPVPSLSVLGLGMLSLALGVVGWRRARHGGSKALSVLMTAGAVGLALHGGDAVVREVRAAGPYALSNVLGGSISDSMAYSASPGLQVVTNTTSVPLRITSNGNTAETGTCAVNSVLQPGDSCTTMPVCTAPTVLPIGGLVAPNWACSTTQVFNTYVGGRALSVYRPNIQPPSYTEPAGGAPNWSFSPNPLTPDSTDTSGGITNPALRTFNATVTLTAPSGYGFAPDLAPTRSWVMGPLICNVVDDDDDGDIPGGW